MNRLTGNDAKHLREAYSSIYESEEINEEQIIENFNLWVDELINEGYDLSEYTYDDLYEYYIQEGGLGAAILKGATKYGGRALTALRKGVKSTYHGSNVFNPKTGSYEFVPGGKEEIKKALARTGRYGVKIGIPVAAGAGIVKWLTGDRGGEWAGQGVQSVRRAGHNLPRPSDVERSMQSGGDAIRSGTNVIQQTKDTLAPYFQDPRKTNVEKPSSKDKKGGVPPVPSWLPQNECLNYDIEQENNEAYDWSSAPTDKPWAPLTRGGQTKIYVPGLGWQFPATARNYFREKGDPNWNRIPNPPQPVRPATPPAAPSRPAQTTPPAAPAGASKPAPAAPSRPAQTTPPAAPAGASKPAPAVPSIPAPPAVPSIPAPPTDASKPAPAPIRKPSPADVSAANLSVADKIKGGMNIYKQQVKTGDVKGAEETGKNVWALANPRLAAAADERSRIRGTAQTDNPLMRGFRLPLTPTVQSPGLQQAVGKASGYQSLTRNPNAAIAAPTGSYTRPPVSSPTRTAGGAAGPLRPPVVVTQQTKPTPAASTARPAATTKPNPMTKPVEKKVLTQSYQPDYYDIILEYLIDRGHADSLEEANYIMLEMDKSSLQSIVEEYHDYLLSVEISEWVDSLIDEGHDLSEYTWDDLVEYYIAEAV